MFAAGKKTEVRRFDTLHLMKIAIIGAGAAGLSAAYDLVNAGHCSHTMALESLLENMLPAEEAAIL